MKTFKILSLISFILFCYIFNCDAQKYNTKLGNFALKANTTGEQNTAIGESSLERIILAPLILPWAPFPYLPIQRDMVMLPSAVLHCILT